MAQALRPRGTAERARGRYAEAEATFERAAALATTGFGRESLEVAELLNDLGMTFKYAGRFDDAERAYQETRTILEAIDADPEDLAALYHNLGGLAHIRRDFAGADVLSAERSRSARAHSVRGMSRRCSTGAPTQRSSTAWVAMTTRRPPSATSWVTSRRASAPTTRRSRSP